MKQKYMGMFSCLLGQWRDHVQVELVIAGFEGFLIGKVNLCAFFDHFGGINLGLSVYVSHNDEFVPINMAQLRAD
ncbi:uncharacterized protein N7496_001470 [Penicillium cataractarum]|uniref:Uncharacterized protein n=1 Tax=Penicillium cataractarum TaxID=2100454 RepID=A0A9W9VVX8_9EURO|nr:uncharacterized protein N7496_001470 [Penicillium cataractarum]KAJ5390402.1 hypothetical protein N7496_001470 [Penicillium cataractarum]